MAAGGMSLLDSQGRLSLSLLRCEFLALQKLAQIHAIDEIHEQVVESARLAEVMNGDDVRTIERGERCLNLRLAAVVESGPSGGADKDLRYRWTFWLRLEGSC